jgi:autotransporter-associated beta strand protein
VTLTAGQLNINHANALGATAGTLAINGGTIDNTSSGGAITNAGNNAISIGGSFAFGGTNDLNLGTGAVSGDITRTITLNGTGKTLTLGGTWTNTANNTTRTLTVNGIGNTLSLGGIAISANTTAATTLTIAGTANVNVTGAITDGSGPAGSGLTITNNGTVTLSGANTYTGNTTLASGVTLIANSLGSGSGSVLATVSSGNTATLGLRSDGNAVFAKNILGSSAQAIAGILNLNVDRATAGGASNGTITLGTGGTLSFNSDSGGLLFTGSNGYGLTLNQSLTYATANNQGNKPNITNNSTGLVTILGNITTGNVNNGRFEMTGTGDTRVNGTMGGGSAPWYLNKTGSGTLTLANAVTPGAASRPYVVQAGTLQFAVRSALSNATTGNWTAAKIVVASGATLAFNVGGANEFTTSDITTLLTNLAASTATTVSATTGNGMNAGSILGFDTTNASGGNFTITDTIANTTGASGGSRGLTKLGTGTLLLSGNNTYTGTNTLSAGTLQVGHANALGTSGNITFSGGTMQFASGGSGADYGSRIKNSASTMVLDTNGQSVTFSGAIDSSNTAGLTKTGTGTLTLSAANSYTGGTAINAGTLQVGDANALGTSGNITFSGGTMSFSSSGAGADYGSRIKNSASAMVFDTNGQSVTFGAIDNSNANGLTKNGSGTLTLSGANTYTGATTVNAGTLTLSGGLSNSSVTVNGGFLNQTSTGSIAGTGTTFTLTTGNATLAGTNTYTGATTVNGGTLSVLGSVASSATTVNNGATLTGNGTTGAITIASGASINPGVGVGTINTGGVTLNGGGIYNWQLWNAGGSAGSGWDLISSTGALTIGAGSNFTINISTVQNQAGTAGTASGFVNSQNYSWRLAEFGSAISGFDPNFFILNSTGFQNSLAGSFSLNATGNFLNLLYTTNLADVTYTAGTGNWSTATNWNSNPNLPTSANALTINGTGGTSTNDLLDTVQSLAIASSAGSYTIAGSGNGSTVTLNGGITNSSSNNQTISMDMNLGADQSIQSDAGNLLLSGALGTSNRTLTITGAGNVVITNTISGNGAIEKTGAGTLTLNGTNTYTGTTTVTGGTLALNGGLNNSSVTVNGGLLNQASTGSIAGTGTSFTLTTGNATLAGTNTYTGATTINGGTLTLSGGLNNSSVTVNGGLLNQTSTGSIAGTGTTFTLTTGNATLSGNNTYTGATAVNGGTLEIASTGRLGGGSYGGNISNNGTFIYSGTNNQTLSGIISGTGALTQNNSVSTLTLAGNNAYTGATTINAGTLQIGAGSTTGSLSTSSAITNNGTLAFNRTNTITQGTDFASVISGTGNLIQAGSGNLVLSGNNTYTGTTTISAGTLEIASSGRLGGGSYAQNITNNGVFLYSGTNNQTLSGIISGTGALTHNTAGGNTTTLTLAGNNTYSGNTTVSAGILNIQHANALGGSANGTTVASGAVLQLQGGINIASEALTLNGSGVSNGGALVNSSGNNEWAGNITIGSATTLIHANTGTTLTISGNITNNAGAALHFQGSGGNITVSGIISGNGSLVTSASGPPSLTLSGANTYTSTTTISGGTVSINSIKDVGAGASSLGAAITTTNGTIAIGLQSANATLRYTGSGDSSNRTINLAGQTGGATIDQSGTGTLRFTSNFTAGGAGSKTLILQGSTAGIGEIAGAVVNNNSTNTTSLTKNGTGTWILSGANTYTGATTINAGTLQIGNGSSTGSLSASSAITNNGTLVFNRSGTVTQGTNFANSISGSGNLTQAGSGTLALGGTNTYTGLTTISAGNLSISSASALGSTSGINLANATALIYTGGVGDLTRNISVTGGTGSTGTIRNDGGALTLSGALTKNGTTLALQGGSGGITVSGSIGGSNANSDLIIDGGSVTLYAANTYNGPTSIINGGTLNANFANALPTANGRTAISIDATGSGNSTLALGVSQSIASLTGNTTSTVTLGSNTLTIGTASGNTTYAGRITGGSTSALVKDGASTQVLTGDNTGFTGTTTINGTGTLQAAAAGALGGTTNIDVNGGSLLVAVANAVNSNANINLGGGTLAVSGNFNQNVGALTLSADSVIDLEGFSGILRFSGLSWASGASNAKLAIWNWSGTPQHGPPVNDYTNPSHVVFANNANLTAENLAKISFYSGGNNSGFIGNAFAQSFSDPSFSGTEIIAVPEPETYLTVVILLLGGIIYLRRQAKHREGHRPAWPKFLLGSRETTPAHHPAPQAPDPHPAHKGARSSRA